jgi:hypothetical protein
VYETRKIHNGPHVGAEADLIVGFAAGYRVSWATSTGNIALTDREGALALADVIEDNLSNWSGDHVSVAADLVEGLSSAIARSSSRRAASISCTSLRPYCRSFPSPSRPSATSHRSHSGEIPRTSL